MKIYLAEKGIGCEDVAYAGTPADRRDGAKDAKRHMGSWKWRLADCCYHLEWPAANSYYYHLGQPSLRPFHGAGGELKKILWR
jgi:hypothetical protein